MAVAIIPITDHELYTVNGKQIYKDGNGNWVAKIEFTPAESSAFNQYKKLVIENPAFKKHTKANYKG
jgi:hypothetical protein